MENIYYYLGFTGLTLVFLITAILIRREEKKRERTKSGNVFDIPFTKKLRAFALLYGAFSLLYWVLAKKGDQLGCITTIILEVIILFGIWYYTERFITQRYQSSAKDEESYEAH